MPQSKSSTPPPNSTKPKKKSSNNRVEFSPLSSGRRGSTPQRSLGPQHAKLQSKESVERDKVRRLEIVARAKARRELMLKRVRKEKKFMLFSSIFAFLSLFLWFGAVFTDHWFYVSQTEEMIEKALNNTLIADNEDKIFLKSNTGLWKTCENFQEIKSQLIRVECSYFSIFLTTLEEANEGPNTHNEHIIDYTRAQICFAFISVLLMIMTIIAAFYTFKNSRYVYKRLASCLYFMTTITILVVLEVLVTSVNYAEARLYPPGAIVVYGFSFYLGWSVFLVYLINGCIFLILSRKRKHDKYDDDADGGLITGR